MKESFVKAHGAGIGFKLNRLSFSVSTPLSHTNYVTDSELFVDGTKVVGWKFQETVLRDDHIVVVAVSPLVIMQLFQL